VLPLKRKFALQIDEPLVFKDPSSEDNPQSPNNGDRDSYDDKQMIRDLLKIVLSADFPAQGDLDFKEEITALRTALSHLQKSFSQADALDEQFKLSAAISHLSSSLSKLVRAQEFLRKNQPSAMNQALEAAIQDVLAEWGRT